jgi:25S rRNA (adenine2142-N1)-methyltransferase
LKERRTLDNAPEPQAALAEIEHQLSNLGGLERYQQLSALGQREERGGGAEKFFIQWMKELNVHRVRSRSEDSTKLRLLEVGAIKPDNYRTCSSWIDWTPIDLHSRHHQILEQDFLLMDADQHANKWDAISLSLVLNFVPLPFDRGRMLELANNMLVSDGLLFLSLPLPCVANSRYITFEHLKSLMLSIGFSEVRNRWRQKGKMAYWLYKKTTISEIQPSSTFDKRVVLRQGRRNNFAITLTGMASMKVK